jgi:hypothetical protein
MTGNNSSKKGKKARAEKVARERGTRLKNSRKWIERFLISEFVIIVKKALIK